MSNFFSPHATVQSYREESHLPNVQIRSFFQLLFFAFSKLFSLGNPHFLIFILYCIVKIIVPKLSGIPSARNQDLRFPSASSIIYPSSLTASSLDPSHSRFHVLTTAVAPDTDASVVLAYQDNARQSRRPRRLILHLSPT